MIASARRDIAFAKINLSLHVRRRRDDGFHDLETLFAFLDDGDRMMAKDSDAFALTLTILTIVLTFGLLCASFLPED